MPPSAKCYPSLPESTLRPTLLAPLKYTIFLRHSDNDASLVDSCTCKPWIRMLSTHMRTP
eukprot:11455795-Ditylum_brightwellii.AAC.1